MKNIKSFILEKGKSYIDLAHEWWEYEADYDKYKPEKDKEHPNKEAERLGISDEEYNCLCDWCEWLYNKYHKETYSFDIDGPKANGPEEWHEAIDWLMGAVYRL